MTFDLDIEPRKLMGATLYGPGKDKIGTIGQVYLDDMTRRPEWATVSTGLFGRRESFVPLDGAEQVEDGVIVPFDKDTIKDAPNVEPDRGHISREEEEELDEYYQRRASRSPRDGEADTDSERNDDDALYEQYENGGRDREDDDLLLGKQSSSASAEEPTSAAGGTGGEPRLRRWVETDYESVEVPVRRERVALGDEDEDDQY